MIACDVVETNVDRAVRTLGVDAVAPGEIISQPVDVFAPCALGAVLNERSIPQLRAGIVAGAANNQLATEHAGAHLQDRGILYCPDFLINAGGIIDVYHQRLGSGDAEKRQHIQRIEGTLATVLSRADESHCQTNRIAEQLAGEILHKANTPLAA